MEAQIAARILLRVRVPSLCKAEQAMASREPATSMVNCLGESPRHYVCSKMACPIHNNYSDQRLNVEIP